MKGTITVKIFEVSENESRMGVYADIENVSTEDKISIVNGVMEAMNFIRSERKMMCLALVFNASNAGVKNEQHIIGEGAEAEFDKFRGGFDT